MNLVVEEAVVRAIESEAMDHALQRVLQGPAVERAVERALSSPAVERAAIEALDSDLVDKVWDKLLDSDEVQRLIERIAEAPEIRAAITSQGIGMLEDLGRQLARVTRRLDDAVERVVRRVVRRPQRTERTNHAGLATRGLAFGLDLALINVSFIALSALISFVFGNADGDASTLLVGASAWLVVTGCYLVFFWSLAGQTLGMRLVGVRLDSNGVRRIGGRKAFRRLVGLVLAIIPLGLGLVRIIATDNRRGFQDRMADTDVIYSDRPPPTTR